MPRTRESVVHPGSIELRWERLPHCLASGICRVRRAPRVWCPRCGRGAADASGGGTDGTIAGFGLAHALDNVVLFSFFACVLACSTLRRPRVNLFDRLPDEGGAVLLGTACVFCVADPALAPATERNSLAVQRAAIAENMPAVEVFALVYSEGMGSADYPFTTAFYESDAYKHLRKTHVEDLLPVTMADTPAVASLELATRSRILWDARFISLASDSCVRSPVHERSGADA